jgi:hypothetical protein
MKAHGSSFDNRPSARKIAALTPMRLAMFVLIGLVLA